MPASPATARLDRRPVPRVLSRTARPPLRASHGLGTLVRACRPRQWTKNVVLAMPPAAAGVLGSATILPLVGAIAVFSLAASATYLINDVRDRHEDRLHPRKRHRPVAAGELSPARALRLARWLIVASVAAAALITPLLAAVVCGYLALTITYSLWWRHVVILDVLAIAAGFLLRAVAGGVATGVRLSTSFLIVTSACALFLVLGKRYGEAATDDPADAASDPRLAPTGSRTRRTLRSYRGRTLHSLLAGSALTAALAYAYWGFARPNPSMFRELSFVPFVLWLLRYANRLDSGEADAPEELIFGDRILLTIAGSWALLFLAGVYGTG